MKIKKMIKLKKILFKNNLMITLNKNKTMNNKILNKKLMKANKIYD